MGSFSGVVKIGLVVYNDKEDQRQPKSVLIALLLRMFGDISDQNIPVLFSKV